MILECKAPVNIISANTKTVDDKLFGQMVLQFPDDENSLKRILSYLESFDNLTIKEEEDV